MKYYLELLTKFLRYFFQFEGLPVLEDDPNFSYVEEREEPEFQVLFGRDKRIGQLKQNLSFSNSYCV